MVAMATRRALDTHGAPGMVAAAAVMGEGEEEEMAVVVVEGANLF